MQTKTKRENFMQNARQILEVNTSTASAPVEKPMARKNTTTRRIKRPDLQTGVKRNATSSFLASHAVRVGKKCVKCYEDNTEERKCVP